MSELVAEMKQLVRFRKAVMKAFENARKLFLSNGGQKMIEGQKSKPVYYNDPRENPKRRVMCDFLISKGREDYYDQTRFYSNYELERICVCEGMDMKKQPEAMKSWHEHD